MNELLTGVKVEYCKQSVKRGDYDRYLSALFAPVQARDALFVLYAFNHELSQIPARVSEPMLGEIRLQWWRETLDGFEAGEARRHDVVESLYAIQKHYSLPQDSLSRLVDVRARDVYGEPFKTVEEAVCYADESTGLLMELAISILGTDENTEHERMGKAARTAGRLYGLTRLAVDPAFKGLTQELKRADLEKDIRVLTQELRILLPKVPDTALPALLPALLCPGYLKHDRLSPLSKRFRLLWGYLLKRF